jgi:hypothetical protein
MSGQPFEYKDDDMGDMADFCLDSQDPWEDYDEPYESPIKYKTCSKCGTSGLIWYAKVDGKWALGTVDYERHFCNTKPKPKATWEDKAREFNERKDTRTMPEVMADIWKNGFQ